MSNEILDWVHKCLIEDEDVIVPLKKLWSRYGQAGKPPFEQFAFTVLNDDRFEQMYSLDHDLSLEAFGYYGGPRVKLRSRELTAQCIFRIVRNHNERAVQVLMRALEILGDESTQSSEESLSEAILMLEGLRPLFKPWVHLRPKDQET